MFVLMAIMVTLQQVNVSPNVPNQQQVMLVILHKEKYVLNGVMPSLMIMPIIQQDNVSLLNAHRDTTEAYLQMQEV